MKKENLTIIHNNRSKYHNRSIYHWSFIGQSFLLAILIFPSWALGSTGSPFGNVKLTGISYSYPIGFEGSPYLFDDWKIANLLLENGEVAEAVKVKLNLVNNDLVFYNEELKRVFVVDKETVRSFTINPGREDSLYFVRYLGEGIGYKLKTNDFITVLDSGAVCFYLKNMADVVNASDVTSKNKIYPKKYYFLQGKNGSVQVKLSYRSIYKLFPGKRKEIKKLISQNKLSRANEWNVKNLIGLINQDEGIKGTFMGK